MQLRFVSMPELCSSDTSDSDMTMMLQDTSDIVDAVLSEIIGGRKDLSQHRVRKTSSSLIDLESDGVQETGDDASKAQDDEHS